MKHRNNKAVQKLGVLTLVAMTVIASNVFFVSVLHRHFKSDSDINDYIDSNYIRNEDIKASRGKILDRSGNVIAEDNYTYNIFCILDENRYEPDGKTPAFVKDKEGTAKHLSRILGMDYDECLKALSKKGVYQVELGLAGRNISQSKKEEIDRLKLPGIGFTESIQRVYPMGTFASNLVGFAQSDENGTTVGQMGAELYLDSYLRGHDGKVMAQVDRRGYVLPGMKEEIQSAENGNDVYLTLDEDIQQALEESFKMTVDTFGESRIWASVMEVDTGKILGWGQYPSFDPNTKVILDYNNYGAQIPYEPGSTLKGITWSAAINEGVYDGDALVYSGPYHFSNDEHNNPIRVESGGWGTIYNAGKRNFGMISYDKALVYSSNTVAAEIQNKLITPDINLEYLKRFGYFQPVNSDGMLEETGTLNFTWPADKLALCYGQGSTVTMLQMIQAYSAIFSDGKMKRPYYVDSIRDAYDKNKIIYQAKTKITGEPITEESAKRMQKVMYRVINDNDGSGRHYQIPECKLIGKTGTTQVASNGTYQSGTTITSVMVGMPAEDPKVLVYYAYEAAYNPSSHWKSAPIINTLRKVAMKLAFAENQEAQQNQDGTTNNETVEPKHIETYDMPQCVNHTIDYAKEKLNDIQSNVYILGAGDTIINQSPRANNPVMSGQRVFLTTETNSFTMMDLTGWTRKDVANLWDATQFGFKLEGDGVVVKQNIPPGTVVNKGQTIEVVFE